MLLSSLKLAGVRLGLIINCGELNLTDGPSRWNRSGARQWSRQRKRGQYTPFPRFPSVQNPTRPFHQMPKLFLSCSLRLGSPLWRLDGRLAVLNPLGHANY
jgi:hypothetical protein